MLIGLFNFGMWYSGRSWHPLRMDNSIYKRRYQVSTKGESRADTEAFFTSPLQLFGRIWQAMFASARIWTGVPRHWRFPPASGGHPHRLSPPNGGLGSLPNAWGALNKANAIGAEGIFGNAGCVWTTALRPDPP